MTLLAGSAIAIDFTFNDPLVDAADADQPIEIFRLIKKGHPVDSRGDFKTTALMRAAYHGYDDIMKTLIASGANVDMADRGGATALHLAARNGRVEAVKMLLKYGADINAADKEGYTPIMRAILAHQPAVVNTLVDAGADIGKLNDNEESPLMQAAMSGSMDVLATLMGSKQFNQIPQDQKQMALDIAKEKHNRAMVTILSSLLHPAPRYASRAPSAPAIMNGAMAQGQMQARTPSLAPMQAARTQAQSQQIANSAAPSYPVEVPENGFENKNAPQELLNRKAPMASAQQSVTPVQNPSPGAPMPWQQPAANTAYAQPNPAMQHSPYGQMQPGRYAAPAPAPAPIQYLLQLGAFANEDQAYYVWTNLKQRNPDILHNLQPDIIKAFLAYDQTNVYRLRASSFTDQAKANDTCRILRERNVECFVVEKAAGSSAPMPTPPIQQQQQVRGVSPQSERIAPQQGSQQNAYAMGQQPNAPTHSAMGMMPPAYGQRQSAQAQHYQNGNGPIDVKPASQQPAQPPYGAYAPQQQQQQMMAAPTPQLHPQQMANASNANNLPPTYNEATEMTRRQFYRSQGMNPPTASHDYGDFYRDIQNIQHDKNAYRGVSEAVRVDNAPSGTYGNGGYGSGAIGSNPMTSSVLNTGAYTQSRAGIWVQIGDFPSEKHAADYFQRMFQYDQSFAQLQMVTMKEQAPLGNFQMVSLRVGPAASEADAYEICRIARQGGYNCNVLSANKTAGYQRFEDTSAHANMPAPETLEPFWLTLGTFETVSDAEYYWMYLLQDDFDILGALKYDVSKRAQSTKQPMHLRAGPFQSYAQATRMCDVLKYRNVACLVTH